MGCPPSRTGTTKGTMSPTPPILFLGDSITEFWKYEGRGPWNRSFARCINRGVSGDRVRDTATHLQTPALSSLSPARWILLIGANDLLCGSPAPQVAAQIEPLLPMLRRMYPDALGILHGVLPLSVVPDGYRREAWTLNRTLEGMAERAGVRWFDAWSVFVDDAGRIPFSLMPDGVHLTAAGYELWANRLVPFLESTGFRPETGI